MSIVLERTVRSILLMSGRDQSIESQGKARCALRCACQSSLRTPRSCRFRHPVSLGAQKIHADFNVNQFGVLVVGCDQQTGKEMDTIKRALPLFGNDPVGPRNTIIGFHLDSEPTPPITPNTTTERGQ